MINRKSKKAYFLVGLANSVKKLMFVQLIIGTLSFSSGYAAPFDELTDRHKRLIDELVALTEEMTPFREVVREHYHAQVFVPTEKMFVGSILENDPQARKVMNQAIDSVIDQEFDEGLSIKYVHYQSFSPQFSEKDLEELLKFYRTDVGKKTMALMSELFNDWEENRQRWAVSLRNEVRNEVKRRLNEYHEKRLAQDAAALERK